MWSVIRTGTKKLDFLVGVISNRRRKFKLLGLQGAPLTVPSLNGTS